MLLEPTCLRALASWSRHRLLIAEFIKKDSPLLPNPCHFQNYDRMKRSHLRFRLAVEPFRIFRV